MIDLVDRKEAMAPRKMPKRRIELLLSLENLIGNECYNPNIRNGVWPEGREFRYPMTFIGPDGKRTKWPNTTSGEIVMTGYYAFGANQLRIIQGLDRVLHFLEEKHHLVI